MREVPFLRKNYTGKIRQNVNSLTSCSVEIYQTVEHCLYIQTNGSRA